MRLLHTADWHLGRSFHNVSLIEDQAHALCAVWCRCSVFRLFVPCREHPASL
jgi:hypothetical protein